MARCSCCSAPLAANTNKCLYCGTRNDVDLRDNHHYSIVRAQTNYLCPHCEKALQTIDLGLNGAFLIERCANCFGLFFAHGKIEALLEHSVASVFDINLQQLDHINQDRYLSDKADSYIKCPACQLFMSKNVYGYRSGVIVDRCKNHGVWLDSGEITHLMEWKKAGGQLLHEQHQIDHKASDLPSLKQKKRANSKLDYALLSEDTENILDSLKRLFY
jgi:Zn-finger nucleic acid-binding protein